MTEYDKRSVPEGEIKEFCHLPTSRGFPIIIVQHGWLVGWLVGWLALRIPNTLSAKYKILGVLRWLLGSGLTRGLTVGVDTRTHYQGKP